MTSHTLATLVRHRCVPALARFSCSTKLGTMPDRSSSMAHRLSITTANHSPRLSNSGSSTVSPLPGSPSKTGAGAGAAGSPATPATPKSSGVDEEAKLLGLQVRRFGWAHKGVRKSSTRCLLCTT